MNDVEPTIANEPEPYESPELTVVGEFGEVTKGNYSRPNSDDSDAGGYWSP
ncbi:MAG: lasso RiPP family leader peptide-containing protein [Pseudonocardiaceae bacterium]